MSRFFRSASSSSSSTSQSEAENEDSHESPSQSQLIAVQERHAGDDDTSQSNAIARNTSSGNPTSHRDLLLHALLEERCLRQAKDELGHGASAGRIDRLAQSHYHTLSQRLAAYGLIEPGLEISALTSDRQAVRDGLDALMGRGENAQINAAVQRNVSPVHDVHQLEIGMDTLQLFRPPRLEMPQLHSIQPPINFANMLLQSSTDLATTSSALFNGSRYAREFEEIGTLGRGGYGVVYHCRHRFDGLSYAVKKVPLSTSRLQRIREQGQAEVDRLLLELTTLAKLEHANIVRYFGGWIEWAQFDSMVSDDSVTFGASESSRAVSGLSVPSARVAEVQDDFISFEESTSRTTKSTAEYESGESLQRHITRGTQATVSDEDIESINRSASAAASAEYSTLSNLARDPTPCLALHIQMGLYPYTLAEYLSRDTADSSARLHCFHIEPSLHILSALVDGIIYLHSQAIVHRDLKPANVFLAPQQQPGWCRQCSRSGTSDVEGLKIRIGDFGLVAALAQIDTDDLTIPVGTELYRPHDKIDRSRLDALDWFALGIIAFELLWPFSTRMERHETLSSLKAGLYPHTFEQHFEDRSGEILRLLEYLLRSNHVVRSDELQVMISSILANSQH